MNWLKQLVTGKDNQTHDLGRWSWVISMTVIIGHSINNVIQSGSIDLVQLATALSTIAGAHGLALFAKKDTEPNEPTA